MSVTLDKEILVSKWINEEIMTFVIASLSTLFLIFLARSIWVRTVTVIDQRDELEEVVANRTKELIESNLKLEQLSQIDSLTGIANRRYLEEQFENEFMRALRNGSAISVAMIDIDYFKVFNDTYGHLEGDECLKHVASVLNSLMRRSTDLLARYGGEEFICLLPETDAHSAHHLAEQLRSGIEKESFEDHSSGERRSITISVGVATTVPKRGDTYQQLIKDADMALYQAKADGRNLVR